MYTAIADKAFENCTKLKKVSVESAFFEVGKNIFDGCDGLTVECYEGTYIYKALQAKNNITLIGKERPQKVEIDNVSYWGDSSSDELELDAQIFTQRKNTCLFLALYVLKYSHE